MLSSLPARSVAPLRRTARRPARNGRHLAQSARAAVTVTQLLELGTSPAGIAATVAVVAAVAAALVAAKSRASVLSPASTDAFEASPPPPPKQPRDAVLVIGAGGRLGREVVTALLAAGRDVVAAAREPDAAKTRATLAPADNGRLFFRGDVDVTRPESLTEALFEGVTQVVSATGAVFGKQADGSMGYFDNMTSERVDFAGNAALAAACAAHLKPAVLAPMPVLGFATAEDAAKWRKLDDNIMGGQSSSALAVSPDGAYSTWTGELIIEGGGFCGTRCDALDLDLASYDGLAFRVRGDGQRYKVNIKTAANSERPESIYQAVLDLRASAGDWATVRLGWHQFVPVYRQLEDEEAPPLDPSCLRSLGLVLSRFEYNNTPNFCFRPGPFKLDIEAITAFAEPRPALLMVSSAGVERNARIGADPVKRAADIPIVQLNPGGVLNWKYKGEQAVRFAAGSLPYAVLRPTGLDGGAETPSPLEYGQGDAMAGRVSRAEVAVAVASALGSPYASGRTFEIRRSEAASEAGKTSDSASL